ncbi:MAG: ABC transporter permease/substrate-binding protein, partial [Bacteroidales bacterium]|nr:ABC transporter permease/substrate-binding protein [Bacteroidales bacterium]
MELIRAMLLTFVERYDYFLELLFQHIILSISAIAIIVLIGVGTGIGILYYPRSRRVILGLVNFLYTIPSIAMFGLFIPLVGIGFANALPVLVLYGLLPMIRNTYTGLNEVEPQLLDAAKAMGATPMQVFAKVRWPLAFPTVLSGFRTMTVMTIALAGLASFIGAGGLGQAIYRGINTNNSSLILAGSVSVALLALLADGATGLLEKHFSRKKNSSGNRIVKYGTLILLSGFIMMMIKWSPGTFTRKEIVVASKPTAEQYILGEIIAQMIENHTELSVTRKLGIGGGTSNIHPAMLSGEVDIYPEYTGTAWLFVLKETPIQNPDDLFNILKENYLSKYDLNWLGLLGFNNTFTLAMPENTAREHNVKTFSELVAVSNNFSFGAEFDFFEREDGFSALKQFYPFAFDKIVELDVNLKFQALANN